MRLQRLENPLGNPAKPPAIRLSARQGVPLGGNALAAIGLLPRNPKTGLSSGGVAARRIETLICRQYVPFHVFRVLCWPSPSGRSWPR